MTMLGRIRFGIRHLIVALTLCCISFCFVGLRISQYRAARQHANELELLITPPSGGDVGYVLLGSRADHRVFLSDWINGSFPSFDVVAVGLHKDTPSIRRVLQFLSGFPTVRELDLSFTNVNDSDLAILPNTCPNLSKLVLANTSITNVSVQYIVDLHRIETLNARRTQLTGRGFQQLAKGCPALMDLNLSDTRLTDAGLFEISQCRALKSLDISDTKISADAILAVSYIVTLEELTIQGVLVDKANLSKLKSLMPNLEVLE